MGKHAVGVRNRKGERIAELTAATNDFKKRTSAKVMYTSGGLHSQIDYSMCQGKEPQRVHNCTVVEL